MSRRMRYGKTFRSRVGRGTGVLMALAAMLAAPRPSGAQDYYNSDAGRPGRVEDALPTPRYTLDLQLLPVRFERLESGLQRWRADSKVSYGIAPFTEIELRAPYLVVDSRSASGAAANGLGGLAIGALHAFTIETGSIPALAIAGEWVAPVGGLAARVGSYTAKLIGTKTYQPARLSVNVGYGTWSARTSPTNVVSCPGSATGQTLPGCDQGKPIVPDTPCDRIGDGARLACVAGGARTLAAPSTSGAAAASTASVGSRWMAGIGADHAFALASTLVSADVVAERFIGLYDDVDWSAELGLRHQLTPRLVVDIGVARHFGAVHSNSIVAGVSFDAPLQLFRSHGRGT
jgi:hypothetical protein